MNISELLDNLCELREKYGEMQVSILFGSTEFLPVDVEFVEKGVSHDELGSASKPVDLPERLVIRVGHPAVP